MNRIIDISLNNRVIVLVFWFLAAAVGVNSLLKLPIDAVPDVTNVQVQVLTNSPGLAPEEVERFITFPVETAMSGVPSVEEIRSVSKFGLSVITVVFNEGTDIYWARQMVGERLTEARDAIPEQYGVPEMGPISSGLGEIYQFEVRGEDYSPMELRTLLDWNVNYQLRSVPGIVEVNSFGGELKTFQITVEPDKLLSYNVSIADIMEAVNANNQNVGGGYIEHQGEQYLIRGEGLLTTLGDIERVVVAYDEDTATPIYVRNIGTVEFTPMIRQGAVTRDGRGEAVIGIVMMLMGENSRVVSTNVHEKITEIQKSLPEGVTIETFYDRTDLVNRTIKTVAKNLVEGGILVIVVLLLLLGNIRGGIIVALAIPLSMLVSFTAMRFAGLSGNLMSLGAIDFGLIVDGSVVIIENVVRYLHTHKNDKRPHLEKVRAACHEVARPVAFAVGIIIIVYVPILALTGVEGKMFRPMALTVVFALAGSLICALTLMPVLASIFLKNVREKDPILYRLAKWAYLPCLGRVVKHPVLVFATAGMLFIASLGLIRNMGAEFIPQLDEGSIAMQIWRLPSVSLEKSNEISTRAEKVLKEEFPEVDTVISRTGRAEIATDPMGVEISDTYIMLNPRETWRFESKEALVEAIDEALQEKVPGAIFSYSQPIALRVEELISGVRSNVAIKIYGDDNLELMKTKAEEAAVLVRAIPGSADVKAEQVIGLPTIRVQVDREAIARYGVNSEDVLSVVQSIGGTELGTIVEGDRRFALQLRFDPSVRENLHALRDLRIPASMAGQDRLIPLSQVATIVIEEGPAQISRENISRRISVESNVRGRDLASFVAEAQQSLDANLDLPPGWHMEWGGQFENLQAASARLALLVPLALFLIFVLLYSTFNSIRLAVLIYLNVPMALTGGIVALVLRGYPFSISAGVGFIALFGVAVLNGVVLVSYIREMQASGKTPLEAALEGAKVRLRPVLMTALVAALGFLPMALASGAGAEVQRPLATVVIGGLITSTLLTLFVVPAVYRWFSKRAAQIEI